jgi:hypothetical protein
LEFQQPRNANETARHVIFWNAELFGNNDRMIGDEPYSFGSTWMGKQVIQLKDLWHDQRRTWLTTEELKAKVGPHKTFLCRDELLQAIPGQWSMM